jgi:hypothetical protein
MKESNIEGVANHDGPESCAAAREGGGEALTGVRAGRAIEPRNHASPNADAVVGSGRQHAPVRYRERRCGSARSKTPRMHGLSMHENREIPQSPTSRWNVGRAGKAFAMSRR